MKNKKSFILDLLDSKKITASQKERLLLLTANELNRTSEEEKLPLIHTTIRIHNPKVITEFLNTFKENTNLKFSTHIWDNVEKYLTIDDFIKGLTEDRATYKFDELFNHNIDLYNLIKYFLYDPKQKVIDRIPQYGWPNLSDIKIGWQFPNNMLIDWSKKNYDKQINNDNYKFPLQFPLPSYLKPKKRINGKNISTFEDVVNIFKNEIQFRGDNLFDEIDKKRDSIIPDFKVNSLEKLKGVQFFTYTRGVIIAIGRVFEMFKKNELAKNLKIDAYFENDFFILSITQIGSYPIKKIQEKNLRNFIGGDLNYIIENIFSLCDYSIISKFKDVDEKEISGEIKILVKNVEVDTETNKIKSLITDPKLTFNKDNITGFTHLFKFYL